MSTKDKHRAIIIVSNCEVHPVLENTNECSGVPVSKDKLAEYDIEFPFIITIDGFDQHDCLMKLKNRLTGLKNGNN